MLQWATFDRVIVTRAPPSLAIDQIDALANVIASIAGRVGRKVILVQIGQSSGNVSMHRAGGAFARYTAAVRAHVEEVHAVTPGEGLGIRLLRAALTTITKIGSSPSVLHPNVDAMIAALEARGIDGAKLRDCIARTSRP
jgi:hypothetical protein